MTYFRSARHSDLEAIVALLADDAMSAGRETPEPPLAPAYRTAFDEIVSDPRQLPLVVEEEGRLVGYLQLSLIPGLSFRGMKRGLIESVRIASDRRGKGLGAAFIAHAVERARVNGCRLVQLTSTNERAGAHRFYERLGFEATHTGYKLALD
ncbi:GNAT family N-acetyltransferase [uncultured Sphingomonas sp.]|uniref:GNAT family N-acetyltransferase n=1 Tax=uncultured Sphingomonas sp. TaxID=158754 RepID=UPI0035CB9E6A